MANRDTGYSDGLNLPYSLEAEQAVLGAVLLDPESINELDGLSEEQFYLPEHQAIYRVMCGKWLAENETIDFVTVLEALKSEGFFSGEEGKAYLLKLANLVPSISNIRHYAQIIREKHAIRSLIRVSREILDDAMEPGADAKELLDSAEQRIFELRDRRETGGLVSIRQVIVDNYDTFAKMTSEEHRNDFVGIPSGISALDDITTGLNRSDLIIVGARPGMGKTSFALNLAKNVAEKGQTVAIFSLEMSREQLVNRMLSSEARVSGKKLRVGNLSADEWARMAVASSTLYNMPVFLDDTSSITVPEMKARLRRMQRIDFVIVDYLQLMQSAKKTDNRVQEVSDITRNLKIMAKELNVALLVCAQLSRGTEKQTNHRPALADLRESGSIEQDADQVLFLYRDEYYKNEKEDPSQVEMGTSEVIVAKNRHGELGTVKLSWQGEFTKFSGLELHRDG